MGYVAAGSARVVVVENVDEPDAVEAVEAVLRERGTRYTWRAQALGGVEHGGEPQDRKRRFWVGVRAE